MRVSIVMGGTYPARVFEDRAEALLYAEEKKEAAARKGTWVNWHVSMEMEVVPASAEKSGNQRKRRKK